MAAAVSDYRVKYPQDGKLKKNTLGNEWSIELTQNPDILKTINKDGIVTVAFKAEKDENIAIDSAKKLLEDKQVDAVCLNVLKKDNNFGSDYNEIKFITKNEIKDIPLMPKIDVAFKILEYSKELE